MLQKCMNVGTAAAVDGISQNECVLNKKLGLQPTFSLTLHLANASVRHRRHVRGAHPAERTVVDRLPAQTQRKQVSAAEGRG